MLTTQIAIIARKLSLWRPGHLKNLHMGFQTFEMILLPLRQLTVNAGGLQFRLPVFLQRFNGLWIVHVSFAVSKQATGAGTGFDLVCCTVITSATEPMISPAASAVRGLSVSPAKRAPRITATIGLT